MSSCGEPVALNAHMPRIECDSKRTGLVPPTVGRKPRSARRIQSAPTVPIPPQRVAVEASQAVCVGRSGAVLRPAAGERAPHGWPRRPNGAFA